MHEYNNIQTRMLGADSFPYRDIIVDEEVCVRGAACLFMHHSPTTSVDVVVV